MDTGAHVAWFDEIGLGDRGQVGGKGGSLGELMRAGIAVPPGYVVKTRAFERFLESLEREAPVRAAVAALSPGDLEAITACSRALRRRVEEGKLAGEVSARRVVFGSHSPFFYFESAALKVKEAGLAEAESGAVLEGNAAELLR